MTKPLNCSVVNSKGFAATAYWKRSHDAPGPFLKNRLGNDRSRCSLNQNSTVSATQSMARQRYIHWPRTARHATLATGETLQQLRGVTEGSAVNGRVAGGNAPL